MADATKAPDRWRGKLIGIAGLVVVVLIFYFAVLPFGSEFFQSAKAAVGLESGKVAVCIRDEFRRQNDLISSGDFGGVSPRQTGGAKETFFVSAYRFIVDLPVHIRSLFINDINDVRCVAILHGKPEWSAAQKALQENWDKNAPQSLKDRMRTLRERALQDEAIKRLQNGQVPPVRP
jgi:hypothetical protein